MSSVILYITVAERSVKRQQNWVLQNQNQSNYPSQSQQTQITQLTNQNSKQIHVTSRQTRENECDLVAIGFGFTYD